MNKTQKNIIIVSIFLLIAVILFNSYFIFLKLKNIDFVNLKLNTNKLETNTTYQNNNNKKTNFNIINGGTVELTDIYNPLKISFNYILDEALVNNANVKLYTSDKKEIPIIINLEDKNSFLIFPVSGSFMEDSIYTLTIKKELSGSKEKLISKDVEYNIQIKKLYLGADLLLTNKYDSLFKNKKIGLITNQTGIDSLGESTLDKIFKSNEMQLEAIFAPEHGLYGDETSSDYKASYTSKIYGVKVYNLYKDTPNLTAKMLENIDILVFDVQDLGIRNNALLDTLYRCMEGAKSKNKPIYILDRPNPLGGENKIIEGPLSAQGTGIDALPLSYGMTIGEIANYFNQNINCNLTVIPMIGWYRYMTFADCDLDFKYISKDIVDMDGMYLYGTIELSTANTNFNMVNHYHGITVKNVDLKEISEKMNASALSGASFIVEKDENGKDFIRIKITDYKRFNPIKTGIYLLAYGRIVGKENFKIVGTDEISKMLEEYKNPEEIIQSYQDRVLQFMSLRDKYLIYK